MTSTVPDVISVSRPTTPETTVQQLQVQSLPHLNTKNREFTIQEVERITQQRNKQKRSAKWRIGILSILNHEEFKRAYKKK